MTTYEMRQATGLRPGWQVIWAGADLRPGLQHIWAALHGAGGTDEREYRRLAHTPTHTPGISAARCERCRPAWVRAADP